MGNSCPDRFAENRWEFGERGRERRRSVGYINRGEGGGIYRW